MNKNKFQKIEFEYFGNFKEFIENVIKDITAKRDVNIIAHPLTPEYDYARIVNEKANCIDYCIEGHFDMTSIQVLLYTWVHSVKDFPDELREKVNISLEYEEDTMDDKKVDYQKMYIWVNE
jgi:hypothetical protein